MAVAALAPALAALLALISSAAVHAAKTPAQTQVTDPVFFFGEAKFKGINPPWVPKSAKAPPKASTPAASSVDSAKASAASAKSSFKKLSVEKGKVATKFQGIDEYGQLYSGTAPLYNVSNGNQVRPNPSICVGNGFIVQVVSLAIAVYDTQGKLKAGPLALNEFLGLSPWEQGDSINLASCLYDSPTGKFFLALTWQPGSGPNALDKYKQTRDAFVGSGFIVASSTQRDPSKAWNVFFIPGTNDGNSSSNDGKLLGAQTETFSYDIASIGADANGFYLSALATGDTSEAVHQNIYTISKKKLLVAKTFSTLRFLIGKVDVYSVNIRPAVTAGDQKYDSRNGGTMYFVSLEDQFHSTGTEPHTSLALWALTNTASLDAKKPAVTLRYTVVKTPGYIQPLNSITQKGAERRIRGRYDEYPHSVAWSNDAVWATWHASNNTEFGTAADSVVVWTGAKPVWSTKSKLEAKLALFDQFTTTGNSLIYPSISFNSLGKGVIAFTLTGVKYYPTAAFVRVDIQGKYLSDIQITGEGKSYLDLESESTRLPFGLWSTSVTDGSGSIWSVVEYVSNVRTVLDGNWATLIWNTKP